jgi:NAD(P)H-hydrate epimerase
VVYLTREQAREIDRIAMEEVGIPGIALMENAARGIADVARARLAGGLGPVAVVCGPGKNGGDGFAAARHLSNAGLEVRVHLVVPPEAYPDGSDAGTNLRILRAMGVPVRTDVDLAGAAMVLDGIFGTGLTRPVRDPYVAAVRAIHAAGAAGAYVVAIDLPSGLDANTGAVLGIAVHARCTATMVAPKAGFLLGEGPRLVGEVCIVDIGAPPSLVTRVTGGT